MSKKVNFRKIVRSIEQRAADDYVETAEKYCTNLKEIFKDTGLDLTKKVDALLFVKNHTKDNECPPPVKSEYRLCKIDEKYAPIDEPIADLILKLNQLGYKTLFCCCGHPKARASFPVDQFYISFEFGEHIFSLLTEIFKEVTNISIPLTENRLSITAEPKEDYARLFRDITFNKRNNVVTKIESTYWKQTLDFHYFSNRQEEAINCINNLYFKFLSNG